jgi:hypothetical protein
VVLTGTYRTLSVLDAVLVAGNAKRCSGRRPDSGDEPIEKVRRQPLKRRGRSPTESAVFLVCLCDQLGKLWVVKYQTKIRLDAFLHIGWKQGINL